MGYPGWDETDTWLLSGREVGRKAENQRKAEFTGPGAHLVWWDLDSTWLHATLMGFVHHRLMARQDGGKDKNARL